LFEFFEVGIFVRKLKFKTLYLGVGPGKLGLQGRKRWRIGKKDIVWLKSQDFCVFFCPVESKEKPLQK